MDPTSSTSMWYYCGSVAIALIVGLIINRYQRRRLPPGPLALPLLGHLHLLETNIHDGLGKLSDKHGPLMTLNFGMKTTVVVSSSVMGKEILKDHDLNFANRSVPVAARIAYNASDILWSPYSPRLRLFRKICVKELFSPKSLEAMHHIRRVEVRRTVQGIYEDSVKGVDSGRVEVAARAIMTSLNVVTSMMWSKNSDTSAEGKEFRDTMGELVYLLGVPNVSDLFPFLERLDLQGVYRRMQKVFVRFDRLLDSIIDERVSGRSCGSDFLQLMIDLAKGIVHSDDETESIQLTMKDVKAVLLDMVGGGATDTTSSTVEWAMAELMQRPEVLKRAQKELEEVVGLDQAVEESHIPQLHYLQAIVKEVLRLHPATPLLVPHCSAKSVDVGGYLIPKGTQVLVNVWKIQRNPHVWMDPLVFDPERFVDGKRGYNGRDFDYLPFGSGRRICVGLSLGTRIVHYTLASLLHSFDWELPAGEKLDMRERYGLVVHKAMPLVALPKPRLGSHLY